MCAERDLEGSGVRLLGLSGEGSLAHGSQSSALPFVQRVGVEQREFTPRSCAELLRACSNALLDLFTVLQVFRCKGPVKDALFPLALRLEAPMEVVHKSVSVARAGKRVFIPHGRLAVVQLKGIQ